MWVETKNGNLCNLSRATDVALERETITGLWQVNAYFLDGAGDDGEVLHSSTLLASYETQEAGREHMRGLRAMLKADTFACTMTRARG